MKNLTIEDEKTVYAVVDYDDETNYVQPKIVASLQKLFPGVKILKDATELPKTDGAKILDWSSYEKLDFESIMERPEAVLSCSYVIRSVTRALDSSQLLIEKQKGPHPQALPWPNAPPSCR